MPTITASIPIQRSKADTEVAIAMPTLQPKFQMTWGACAASTIMEASAPFWMFSEMCPLVPRSVVCEPSRRIIIPIRGANIIRKVRLVVWEAMLHRSGRNRAVLRWCDNSINMAEMRRFLKKGVRMLLQNTVWRSKMKSLWPGQMIFSPVLCVKMNYAKTNKL